MVQGNRKPYHILINKFETPDKMITDSHKTMDLNNICYVLKTEEVTKGVTEEGIEEVTEGVTKDIRKNKEKINKKKREAFVIPTPNDVTEYGKSINYSIDGEQFCDFYSSKGWMVGKNKIKDWKACVRTWKKRRDDNGKGNSSSIKTANQPAPGKYDQFK